MALIFGMFGPTTLSGTEGVDLVLALGDADFMLGREGDNLILAGGGNRLTPGAPSRVN